MDESVRAVIELNVKHYRGLLKTERDADKREAILKLLADEEKKLANVSKEETE